MLLAITAFYAGVLFGMFVVCLVTAGKDDR